MPSVNTYFPGINNQIYNLFKNPSSELLTTILIVALVFLVVAILTYVFQALAICRIMKSRGLSNAFLAWIPCGGYQYAVGSIYDDINQRDGKTTHFGRLLIILYVASIISPYIISFAAFPIAIVITIFELVCYNLIFKRYAPNNSSYIVLTVIFSLLPIIPFIPGLCLLKASKNEPVSKG